jgi:hypothetical protein
MASTIGFFSTALVDALCFARARVERVGSRAGIMLARKIVDAIG